MIKAVVFDYFGVISSNEYWRQIKHDKRVVHDFPKLSAEVNAGTLHWEDFVAKLAKLTDKSPEEMQKYYETEQVQPNVIAYVAGLHETYKTALLTNAHHEFIDPVIKNANLDKVFDEIIISSTLGLPKPWHRIFTYTLEKLNVKPEEAILIDDGEYNIKSANDIGMRTILYKDFNQMKQDLEKILGTTAQSESLSA